MPWVNVVIPLELSLNWVASGAFGMSRSRMVKLIEGGDVTVGFRPTSNPAQTLAAGEEVRVRALGRLVLHEVGLTSKGK